MQFQFSGHACKKKTTSVNHQVFPSIHDRSKYFYLRVLNDRLFRALFYVRSDRICRPTVIFLCSTIYFSYVPLKIYIQKLLVHIIGYSVEQELNYSSFPIIPIIPSYLISTNLFKKERRNE